MNVLVLAPTQSVERALVQEAKASGFEAKAVRLPQDMCSALYRDPEAIGVIWANSAPFAAITCREWRVAGVKSPLFVLVDEKGSRVEDAITDRVSILVNGGDDVQPLPIHPSEFSARLHALARRDRGPEDTTIKLPGDVVFDVGTGGISFPGGTVSLSGNEAEILAFLAHRPGAVITKEMLMLHLYGGRDEPELKITDVYICKIRKKLSAALGGKDVIQTVWGRGWVFVPEGFEPTLSDARVRLAG
jgi:two-component system cell cycle response regulator CtrA